MNSIQESFDEFQSRVLPASLTQKQREISAVSFYGGIAATLDALDRAIDAGIAGEALVALLLEQVKEFTESALRRYNWLPRG